MRHIKLENLGNNDHPHRLTFTHEEGTAITLALSNLDARLLRDWLNEQNLDQENEMAEGIKPWQEGQLEKVEQKISELLFLLENTIHNYTALDDAYKRLRELYGLTVEALRNQG